MNDIKLATEIAKHYLGLPYRWGGDDPTTGFDCSGFVIELLKSVGKLPRSGDWTAQGLWDRFWEYREDEPSEGCLAFWHNGSGKIIHVEYCINHELSIGASGGGSSTTNAQIASDQNAYIKIRPIHSRTNLAGYRNPFQ